MTTRCPASASSIKRRACAAVAVKGFSTNVCLPARRAASASGKCVESGVAMTTAWMSGASKMSRADCVVRMCG
jgi:hypothetical protein